MYKERKELIFETMEHILDEDGYENLTYANISARCHLHTNTITYYFDDKEDMLVQFFEYIVRKDNEKLPSYYFAIPEGKDYVESFCTLIDHILDGGMLKSRVRRLLNQLLLPHADCSVRVQNFLHKTQVDSSEMEFKAIHMYKQVGILDENNERAAFADITLISAGYSLIHFFNVKCVDVDYSLYAARERIKKAFLKEEYHSMIPQPKSVEAPSMPMFNKF